jgi:hypothetical protein
MNNKKLIGVGLLSVLGLIGVVLLVYAAVNCNVMTLLLAMSLMAQAAVIRFTPTLLVVVVPAQPPAGTTSSVATLVMTPSAAVWGTTRLTAATATTRLMRPPQTAEATTGSSATLALTRLTAALATTSLTAATTMTMR